MIKFERTEVWGMGAALRGMRNPMRSWDKADSVGDAPGEADLALAQKLAQAGTDHRKFLRQIMVSVDITAPRYWWAQHDTYKVGTASNSESTMHTITKKEFEWGDFSVERVGNVPNCDPMYESAFEGILYALNEARHCYLDTGDTAYWWQIIQLLPQSYNQLRTVTLNYEVLLNQYHARKNHKLQEWRDYCEWIEGLPYFREMCLEKELEESNAEG